MWERIYYYFKPPVVVMCYERSKALVCQGPGTSPRSTVDASWEEAGAAGNRLTTTVMCVLLCPPSAEPHWMLTEHPINIYNSHKQSHYGAPSTAGLKRGIKRK